MKSLCSLGVLALFISACSPAPNQTAQAAAPPAATPAPPPAQKSGPVTPPSTDAEKIASAKSAGPEAIASAATVLDVSVDPPKALQKGTNGLVCYDRSGFAQQAPFSVQCTSIANLERVAQNLKAEALGDKTKSEAMLKDLESKGQRVKPEYGSMWHSVAGPDRERATRHHAMIAVPGATTQSTGLPDNPRQGGAWIMNAGTSKAHIMVPGQ